MTAQVEIIEPICPLEVYDHLTQAREILNWMEALAFSIKHANEHGHTDKVQHLADLAHYLGTDWSAHFHHQAEKLLKEQERD